MYYDHLDLTDPVHYAHLPLLKTGIKFTLWTDKGECYSRYLNGEPYVYVVGEIVHHELNSSPELQAEKTIVQYWPEFTPVRNPSMLRLKIITDVSEPDEHGVHRITFKTDF